MLLFEKSPGCRSVNDARIQYQETCAALLNAEQRVSQLEHLNELLVTELANLAAAAAPPIEQVVDGRRTCRFVSWHTPCGKPLPVGETEFCATHKFKG